MAFTTILGAALSVVYIVAGLQLAPAVWSHIVVNLLIGPWLMIGVINLRDAGFPTASASPSNLGAHVPWK